jgi:Ca-activated chloride channel family protein
LPAVLLISDGEDHAGRGLAVARACRERSVVVHCAGIGTALGSKIAYAGRDGEAFVRDRSGADVVSTLDEDSLRAVADAGGGSFVDLSASPRALVALYETAIVPAAHASAAAEPGRGRAPRFQWPLLVAFALFLLELGLTDRVRR